MAASEFLRRKAAEAAAETSRKYGDDAPGGTKWLQKELSKSAEEKEQDRQNYYKSEAEKQIARARAIDPSLSENKTPETGAKLDRSAEAYERAKQEARQKKATEGYEHAQKAAAEDRAIMEADLAEYENWADEDKRALETYVNFRQNSITSGGYAVPARKAYENLVSKYGAEKVANIAESWQRDQNAKATQKLAEYSASAVDGKTGASILHSAATVPANLFGSVAGIYGAALDIATRTGRYSTLDPNNVGNMANVYSGAVRGQVAENISGDEYDETGDLISDGGKVRQLLSYGYQGVMSAADSLARLAIGGEVGSLALAAAGSFSQTVSEASKRGATPEQAIILGVGTAAIEAATEKIPLDNMLKAAKGGKKGAMAIATEALRQAGIEATTEEISLFAGLLWEAAAMQEKSAYKQSIGEGIANGMTYDEAKEQANKAIWAEALNTAAVSAVAGGLSGGGSATFGQVFGNGGEVAAETKPDAQSRAEPAAAQDANQEQQTQPQQGATEQVAQETPATQTPASQEVIKTPEQMVLDAATETGKQFPQQAAPKSELQMQVDNAMETMQAERNGQKNTAPENGAAGREHIPESQIHNWNIKKDAPLGGAQPAVSDSSRDASSDTSFNNIQQKNAEVKGTGAAEANFSGKAQYQELLYEGNVQPDRPGDVRPMEVPKVDGYGRNVPETVSNLYGAKITTDEMASAIEEMIQEGALGFDRKSNRQAIDEAAAAIQNSTPGKIAKQITKNVADGKIKDGDIEKAMLLYNYYAKRKGKAAQENAAELVVDLATMGHMAGRNLQLFKLIRKLTPEGKLMVVQQTAQRSVDNVIRKRGSKEEIEVDIPQNVQDEYLEIARIAADSQEATAYGIAAELEQTVTGQQLAAAAETAVSDYLGSFREPQTESNVSTNDLVDRVGQRVADSLNRRATESNVSVEEVLFRDIMRFVNDKVNAGTQTETRPERTDNLQALADYHRYQPFFQNAWNAARQKAEAAMDGMRADDPRIDVIEDFLATYSIENRDVIAGHEFGNARSTVRRGTAEAARAAGYRMDNKSGTERAAKREMIDVLKQNARAKQRAVDEISRIAAQRMGLDENSAASMAEDIADAFYADLAERSAREISRLLGPKTVTKQQQKTIAQKLGELYNMGAFDNDAQTRQAVFDAVFGDDQKGINVPNDVLERYVNAAGKEQAEIEKEIYKIAASQVKATFKEKWDAWRYMSMLGNAKTQIRNLAGNAAMKPYKAAKDALGAAFEKMLPQDQRTKSFIQDPALLEWAKADAKTDAVHDALKYSGKIGDDVAGQQFSEYRKIFNNEAMESVRKFVEKMPQWGDMISKNGYYAKSLAGFLKARGYTASDIQNGKVTEQVMMEGRSYAVQEAMKATFNDVNAFSDTITSLRFNNPDTWVKKGLNMAMEGVLPFRRTPANIVARFLDYSPAGLARGVVDLGRSVKNENIAAAQAIDEIAAGLTGTGVMVLGYFLAKGIGPVKLVGKQDDEDKKRQGHQAYSLEITLDGETYSATIDWAAPANLPLFVGANFLQAMEEAGADTSMSALSKFLHVSKNSLEPLLLLSCLSGLNDLMESGRYTGEGEALYSIAAEAATSYVTQGIPSLLRQGYQASQKDKLTTFANDPDPTVREAQGVIGQIPIIAKNVQTEKRNAWGETETTESGVWRAVNAFVNPGTLKEINNSELEREITRLGKTQEQNVTPPEIPKKLNYTGTDGTQRKDYRLTEEQYQKLAQAQGQTAKNILESMVKSSEYKKLTDAQKAYAVRAVYEYAQEKGKQAALKDYHSNAAAWIAQTEKTDTQAFIARGAKIALDDAIGNAVADLNNNWKVDNTTQSNMEDSYKAFKGMTEKTQQQIIDEASAETVRYLTARSAGVSTQNYLNATKNVKKLGSNSKAAQKYKAVAGTSGLPESAKDALIKAYMPDYDPKADEPNTTELKYDYARKELGLTAQEFAEVYRVAAEDYKKDEMFAQWKAQGYSAAECSALWALFKASGTKKTDVIAWHNGQ